MQTPALLLIIATLLPLASFVLLMFIGKRMGTPLAGVVATLAMSASFVCSLVAMIMWLSVPDESAWGFGRGPINVPMRWIPVGGGIEQDNPGYLDVGVYVDSVTVVMFGMVTLISTLIFVFS